MSCQLSPEDPNYPVRKICKGCGNIEITTLGKVASENTLFQNVCGPSGWKPRCAKCNRWVGVYEI